MKPFQCIAAWPLLALAVLPSLTSCALKEDSARYTQLAPKAEPNPAPEAIVGMWHYNGGPRAPRSSTSLLFRSNGEGLFRGVWQMDMNGKGEVEPTEFTWHYEGNGKWADSIGGTYQIAEGNLLRTANQWINAYPWETWTNGNVGLTNRVFERLE